MLIDRLGPVLERLPLLPFAFRLYQRVCALSPRLRFGSQPHKLPPDGVPRPSARLMMTVAGSPESAVFLYGGQRAADSIREILRKNGTELGDLRSILDFGCGCGRVLRFWKDPAGPELHGTDYNAELAEWCARNLPFVHAATNALAPPTRYAGESFDLVYALSVFTHLPEKDQHAWMAEFHRILSPGGLLLLSLHGAHYLPRLNDRERRRFLAGALVTRFDHGAGTNLCSVFHPESWVRLHLTGNFEVVDFIPEGAKGNPRQDAWLFRRKGKPAL